MRRTCLLRSSVIVLILAIVSLLAGCLGKNAQRPFTKQSIKQGGQIVVGSLIEPNTLNPLLTNMPTAAEVASLIFSGLVVVNEKGEWVPDLAAEVPTVLNGGVSDKGLTITYKLRRDVRWHNGKPFTSDDVKFTWLVIMNEKYYINSREGYNKISNIETPDPYTVVIHFSEYYAPYLTLFSVILPQHLLNDQDLNTSGFNTAPIGTGPFKFKSWNAAQSIIMDANTQYYRGKPVLDTVVYKIIPDAAMLQNQLKSGEIDIVTDVSTELRDQLRDKKEIKISVTPNMSWEHVVFNLDDPLLSNLKIRQAIALGIDRQAIIDSVLKNIASPAVGDQNPLSWAYDPSQYPVKRDINAARQLLLQAGWKQGDDDIFEQNGQKLRLVLNSIAGDNEQEALNQIIAAQLKKVGILIEINRVEAKKFFDLLKKRRFQAALVVLNGRIDPDNTKLWNSRDIPNINNNFTGENYSGWRNQEIDFLTDQGTATMDIEARKKTYYRIQEILMNDIPAVPLVFRANINAYKSSLVNYKPNPTPAGAFWSMWQVGFKE